MNRLPFSHPLGRNFPKNCRLIHHIHRVDLNNPLSYIFSYFGGNFHVTTIMFLGNKRAMVTIKDPAGETGPHMLMRPAVECNLCGFTPPISTSFRSARNGHLPDVPRRLIFASRLER